MDLVIKAGCQRDSSNFACLSSSSDNEIGPL